MSEPVGESTLWAAVIGAITTVTVGVLSFFGGQGKAKADVTSSITVGFSELTEALREEREHLTARVNALEERERQREGDVRQLQQHIESLERVLREHGIDVPQRPLLHTGVVLEFKGTL